MTGGGWDTLIDGTTVVELEVFNETLGGRVGGIKPGGGGSLVINVLF